MDKAALRQAIVAALEREFAVLVNAADGARAEATDQDSRSEGKFDMRGQLAAYVAAGQAKLAGEVGEAIAAYAGMALPKFGAADPVALGAVVTLKAGARSTVYFLGPSRGGLEVELAGKPIVVVTPASPLGRQLLGKRAGEKVTLPARPKPAEHTVAAVE